MTPNQGTSAAEGKGQDCGEVQLIKKEKRKRNYDLKKKMHIVSFNTPLWCERVCAKLASKQKVLSSNG